MKKKIFLFLLLFLLAFTFYHYNGGVPVTELYDTYLTSESKIVNIKGMPVHYRSSGQGPNLVLMHGVASSLHTWDVWQEILSDNYTVTTFDVPAFGLTGPNPNNDYSVEMYMEVIDSLLHHLNIDRAFVGGNSFGGFLSWKYALHAPEKVQKLLLLNSAGIRPSRDVKDVGFKLMMNASTKGIAQKITPKFIVKKTLKNTYGDPSLVLPEQTQRYYDMLVRSGNRPAFSEVLTKTLNSDEDVYSQLKNIKIPTLIMWGDQDRIIPVEHAHKFKELIPNAELIMYRQIGHIPMEEIPEKSAKDAVMFLEK